MLIGNVQLTGALSMSMSVSMQIYIVLYALVRSEHKRFQMFWDNFC